MIKLFSNQKGDTLIEVMIATVIVGLILTTAYVLSTKAFQLGQSAKERSQAAQLLQEQAEGLRSLRDNQPWSSFIGQFTSIPQQDGFYVYHVKKTQNPDGTITWSIAPGELADAHSNDPDVQSLPYKVAVRSKITDSGNKLESRIEVNWDRFGGGVPESTSLLMKLTNRNLPISYETQLLRSLS